MSRTVRPLARRTLGWLMLALALAALASGCGRSGPPEDERIRRQLNRPEGELALVALAGYAEDGTARRGLDWVSPFERETGCDVNVQVASNPGELVVEMRSGDYDGAAAPTYVVERALENHDVDPINTKLIPGYERLFPQLRRSPLVRGRRVYGIPLVRSPNLVGWNARAVRPAPRSSAAVLDPPQRMRGGIMAYDDPMYIAEAALYLKRRRPELEIRNPYRLDEEQFEATIGVLEAQADRVTEYWREPAEASAALGRRDAVLGTTPPLRGTIGRRAVPVRAALPREGATGRLDAWTIHPSAQHPDCMYLWLEHMVNPEVNAQIAESLHAAPAIRPACRFTEDPDHCELTHAADERFWRRVRLWSLPLANCRDDRGEACKPFDEWVLAWSEIRD